MNREKTKKKTRHTSRMIVGNGKQRIGDSAKAMNHHERRHVLWKYGNIEQYEGHLKKVYEHSIPTH